jgi:2-amino-4-hydroxy-6-hydroxymethyldihydropteridine diphosphokinase
MPASYVSPAVPVCLLLGSNIEPERNLPRAVSELSRRFRVLGVSQVWKTPPVGSSGPDFLNAAVLVETTLEPEAIKQNITRPLEQRLGRIRTADKHAPRTIDIDVVVWGEQTIDPLLWEFAYAAVPVAELLPGLRSISGEERLEELASRLRREAPMQLCQELDLKGYLLASPADLPPEAGPANS